MLAPPSQCPGPVCDVFQAQPSSEASPGRGRAVRGLLVRTLHSERASHADEGRPRAPRHPAWSRPKLLVTSAAWTCPGDFGSETGRFHLETARPVLSSDRGPVARAGSGREGWGAAPWGRSAGAASSCVPCQAPNQPSSGESQALSWSHDTLSHVQTGGLDALALFCSRGSGVGAGPRKSGTWAQMREGGGGR